jgi:hypothetical protein
METAVCLRVSNHFYCHFFSSANTNYVLCVPILDFFVSYFICIFIYFDVNRIDYILS